MNLQYYAEQKKQETKKHTTLFYLYDIIQRKKILSIVTESSSNCTHKLYLNEHDFFKLQELSTRTSISKYLMKGEIVFVPV